MANVPEDLSLIYQGGDNFLARMKALQDQQAAIQGMLDELNLGRPAREAYEDATTKQGVANSVLEEARGRASKMVQDAHDKAAGLILDATNDAAAMRKEATEFRAKAEKAFLDADALKRSAAETASNLDAIKEQAETQERIGRELQAKYTKAIADLHAHIKSVTE